MDQNTLCDLRNRDDQTVARFVVVPGSPISKLLSRLVAWWRNLYSPPSKGEFAIELLGHGCRTPLIRCFPFGRQGLIRFQQEQTDPYT